MEKFFNIFFNKVGIKTSRTKNIARHVSYSFLYKAGSVLANFLLVPLAINYLDTDKYGIWLTLSSVITWFSFFDLGLGNGLRNKFSEAKAKGEEHLAQAYVSSAYFTIGSLSIVFLGIFLALNPLIDWTVVFNTDSTLRDELNVLLPVVFAFFFLRLVIKLVTSIYLANQHHSIQNKIQFYIQTGSLFFIWLLTQTNSSSLLIFGTIYSALPVVILLGLNIYAFSKTLKEFKPKYSLWKKEYLNDIVGLGFRFFIVQIAALVLFSTDNYIITRLFSPEEVVPYNISYKYFSIVTMAYGIIITPYWSSFTEAYARGDYEWIKKSVRTIQKFWLLIPLWLVVMVYFSDWFYMLWVGEKVKVSIYLSLAMALFVTLKTFNLVYVNFINGVGKIKLQLVISIINIIINIPLSIYLGEYLEFGPVGVILATCFCLLYNVFLWPLQYKKLISGKAKGIWDS